MVIKNDSSCCVFTVENLKIFHRGGVVLIAANNVTIIKQGKDNAFVKSKMGLEC